MTRVVVTGLGLLTALGNDLPSCWKRLLQGQSGIRAITGFDTCHHRVRFGGQINAFDPGVYMDRKEVRRSDPFEQIALATSREALAQAQLDITDALADEVGVCFGSCLGGITSLH